MPFQPSVPIGQSAHAANIGSQIRQGECSVGLARQQRDQLARQLGRHAAFEIRQPDRPDRYPRFSQGRIAAAGVEKSKGVAHDLGDATKILIIEKTADDGVPSISSLMRSEPSMRPDPPATVTGRDLN